MRTELVVLVVVSLGVAPGLAACVGDDPTPGSGTAGPASTKPGDDGASEGSAVNPGSSGSSGSSSGDAPTVPTVDVSVLRNPQAAGHPALGSVVRVTDLVVAGVKTAGSTHGFFAQHQSVSLWGGIYVFVGSASVQVVPGDVVSVTGTYKQFRGLDQLDVALPGGKIETTDKKSAPAPIDVEPIEIGDGGAKALSMQSVLVTVKSVVVNNVQTAIDFTVQKQGVAGDLVVTSYIANDTGPSPFGVTMGQTYSSIRGFVYRSGPTDAALQQKLAPTSAADLVSP